MVQKQDRRAFLKTSVAAGALAFAGATATATPPEPSSSAPENPHVRPGRVAWHADFDSACAASERSGKPVFQFQMMGRMDQRFC